MKQLQIILTSLLFSLSSFAADLTDVKMTVTGMSVTMTNGKTTVKIGSDGKVSSMKFNSTELLGSSGVYFD
ncbi:MAG: hypothetical protein MJZ29_12590, partial [Bacteroidaceae bacterium]|nr:hypothetical protein [Bacteroidaceae bacterium]